jgi:hypothetical protein
VWTVSEISMAFETVHLANPGQRRGYTYEVAPVAQQDRASVS